ncbi:bacterial proteasome activator family protein [Actinoplanes sp. NPDC051851]|uniref:bacterial proteasome activator family protein n=1 Tax=Actinoplanes sp. NPDC051851 TaxID=3154753 RepID=UPI00342B2B3B
MTDDTRTTEHKEDGSVIVVGPEGRPMGTIEPDGSLTPEEPGNLIEQPAKVMRIGSMIKQLLEEVRAAPLDEASRSRLREIHQRSITELEDGLAPELREELERLSLPFEGETPPSEAELRIAQAQLVGWLEGLFHGIQAALVAQQMAARLQLEQMRGGVPGRPALPMGTLPGKQAAAGEFHGSAGQYL